jgi:hypothetical protein
MKTEGGLRMRTEGGMRPVDRGGNEDRGRAEGRG